VDLSLFLRVVWSRKWLMAAGLVLATVLAFLSLVRVDIHSSNHFRYRQSEQWASYTTLFVTQHGFPWGTLGTTTGVGQPDQTHATDPTRFISLALIYSQLIPSDAVRQIMIKDGGPIKGTIQAAALTDPSNTNDALPLISIAGLASTPAGSTKLVQRASAAFLTYLSAEQSAAGTAPADRVVVQVINQPGHPKLLQARSTTLPIVVFFTMVLATIALCFILENLRPRVRVMTAEAQNARLADAPPRIA
jgi:hypothetical protein